MGPFRLTAVLFLAASTYAITIPSTPTWPAGRCTDKSLTIPSWILSRYKVAGGTTTFVVNNRATDPDSLSATITCSPGKSQCQSSAGGADIRATLTAGSDGQLVVGISQFWTCGDEGDQVIFTASGRTEITSCSGTDCSSPITYLVQGTLTLPVPLTPAQPKPPTGFDAPACADVGEKQWTVSGVEYKNYTRGQCKQWYDPDKICMDNNAGTFESKGQYLTLNVTNNAISHEVQCAFTPTYNNWNIPTPLRCTGGNFNEITLDITWSGSGPNNQLKIEELWYCLENPKTNNSPTVIVATGSTSLALACESHPGITGGADDIITICTDPTPSQTLSGAQIAKETLPPFSLIVAYPTHAGCTFDSVVNPTFYYTPYYFQTRADGTLSRFNVDLNGPGFARFGIYQNVAISGSGADTMYTCASYFDGNPKERHWKCTYTFNANTKIITQDKVWECRDKNAAAPLYFEGTGEFDLGVNPRSSCSSPGPNQTYCLWHNIPPIPYDIPKVTVSTVNVLPPDYGQLPPAAVAIAPVKTVRENGVWKLAKQE